MNGGSCAETTLRLWAHLCLRYDELVAKEAVDQVERAAKKEQDGRMKVNL